MRAFNSTKGSLDSYLRKTEELAVAAGIVISLSLCATLFGYVIYSALIAS